MNKVWGTPILDEERGTLQQSPNNYIEGLEKRAYGVIRTGIFPLTPDEVQIAKEALRKNNGEGLTDEYGIQKHLEACNVHADKVSADEIWVKTRKDAQRVDLGHYLLVLGNQIHEAHKRNAELEKKVSGLKTLVTNQASAIARIRKRLSILELKSHTHSPKERGEGLRLSDKDQARWDTVIGQVSKTVKAVEEERPSEVVEVLGEVQQAGQQLEVIRLRGGSLMLRMRSTS